MEKELNLALITLDSGTPRKGSSASSFRVGSSKIQVDRWLSLAWKANTSTFGMEECSFKNGTCNRIPSSSSNAVDVFSEDDQMEVEGWPIVSRKKSGSATNTNWKNTLIVGLLQNTTGRSRYRGF